MFFALLIEQFRYQFLTKLPSIGSLTSVAPPAYIKEEGKP
jgi:hypothetical protein